jgi:hypothetical protein
MRFGAAQDQPGQGVKRHPGPAASALFMMAAFPVSITATCTFCVGFKAASTPSSL